MFTSAPKAQFYEKLFLNLDLSHFPEAAAKTGRIGFSKRAMLCAFIVMKCECFSCITDLADHLNNNLIIAHYCGFNIMKPLPSYWTLDRFINKLDNALLKKLMQAQVLKLSEMGVIYASFIALDSTPISANTRQNNSKSFAKNKFSKNNQPKSDMDCGLGVHAITRIGTMAKKLAVVLNMSRFSMITDFPLTVNVFRSRRFMHSEQRLSVTTLVSSRPVRNVFGCIVLMLHKTLILLLILLCSLSLTQLLSLNSKALIAVLNPLSVLLDELF